MANDQRKIHLAFVLLVSCAVQPRAAQAYDFEISARTEAQAYQQRRIGAEGLAMLNRRRVVQYLGLRIFNLWPGASEGSARPSFQAPQVWMHALMRFVTDFGSYARQAARNDELENDQLELLLGAIEARQLWGYVDLSLGRQIETELMDFFAYDGLRLRFNTPWPFAVETALGLQVDRSDPLGFAELELDGTSGTAEADEALAPLFSVGLHAAPLSWIELRAAYRRVSSRARANPGLSAQRAAPQRWGVDQEIVFAQLGLELPVIRARLNAAARYSLLLAQLDDVALSWVQPLGERQQVVIEALRSRPHFDGDSIFNLFETEPYHELAARYSWQQGSFGPRLEARVGQRWYWDADEASPNAHPSADRHDAVLALGLLTGWNEERWSGTLETFFLEGLGGDRLGGELFFQWSSLSTVFGGGWGLQGRVSLVHDTDEDERTAALTSFGAQAGVQLRLVREATLHLLFEDNISRLYRSALRFVAVLDLSFAP